MKMLFHAASLRNLQSAALSVLTLAWSGCASTSSTAPAKKHTGPPPPATAQLVTEIYVRDLKKSQAFYEQFGFKTTLVEPTFRELEFGGRKFFLSQRNSPAPRLPAANIRIGVADVDAYYAKAKQLGVKILTPLQNHEWGERDFAVADPDNFGLRFASLLPGGHW